MVEYGQNLEPQGLIRKIKDLASDLGAAKEIGGGELVGRALAHMASLLFPASSVKVVRHRNWDW